MPFELAFHPEALREWRQLSAGIREQFKKKLAERLVVPRIPASKLRDSSDRYKIKLRSAGFRLVYEGTPEKSRSIAPQLVSSMRNR
ncbi:type II toxin-antitoxin system RelE/ParE family toxin [Synechococcus sp. CBW1107]|uniref:type II toxin-antitoxin system RelE family toxin n=1 Tax=Synechococcus sp. CBW1107 TaxID=2789857 RepID=UPI002AD42BF1|nr:type II toxin-antitoxin system RelE/ParE family toxin [Synechococcus sp. CBW1107]CAK6701897.1 mRNA interferase toxin RelE [Synechococcus sp. CBW1107]